jgi:hypothetical protein
MLFKVTALWVLAGLVLGLGAITLFDVFTGHLNIGTAYVWSFAFFVLGGLAGFIFGVPKIVTSNGTHSSTLGEISQMAAPEKKAKKNIIQENTNLTQISDWLTKVIIGAGLVQLKEIPGFIISVSRKMAKGMHIGAFRPEDLDIFTVLSGGIVVYFITWGFVSGYLVMRLVISELLKDV